MTNTFKPDGSIDTNSSYNPVFSDVTGATSLSSIPADFNLVVDVPAQNNLRMLAKLPSSVLLADLTSGLSSANASLGTLNTTTSGLSSNYTTLNSTVSGLNSTVTTLGTTVSGLNNTVTTQGTQLSSLSGKSAKSQFSSVVTAPTYSGTTAPTTAPVNLNLLGLATVSTEINNANSRYNTLAQKYNDLVDYVNNTVTPMMNALKTAGQT